MKHTLMDKTCEQTPLLYVSYMRDFRRHVKIASRKFRYQNMARKTLYKTGVNVKKCVITESNACIVVLCKNTANAPTFVPSCINTC
jgi:hypothetical protein